MARYLSTINDPSWRTFLQHLNSFKIEWLVYMLCGITLSCFEAESDDKLQCFKDGWASVAVTITFGRLSYEACRSIIVVMVLGNDAHILLDVIYVELL